MLLPNVDVLSTLRVESKSAAPVTVSDPVTDTLSSRVVVPPAESIVRLPEEVSISLLPVSYTHLTLPTKRIV